MKQERMILPESARLLAMWVFLAAFAMGCTQSASPLPEPPAIQAPTALVTDQDHSSLPASGQAMQAPAYPPSKPDAEIAALRQQWSAALATERKTLMTDRLEQWLAALENNDGQGATLLPDAQFAELTTQELLAFLMLHPEDWIQDDSPEVSPAGQIQAISRHLPHDSTHLFPSERQVEALRRDSNVVKRMVVDCISLHKAVSIPMLRTVVEFKLRKAILPLIAVYKSQTTKDDLILTTLAELMERSNFWEWVNGPLCKAMAVDAHGTIPLTRENADNIIAYAQRLAAKP